MWGAIISSLLTAHARLFHLRDGQTRHSAEHQLRQMRSIAKKISDVYEEASALSIGGRVETINYGNLVLQIVSNNQLLAISKTRGFVVSVWTRWVLKHK